MPEWNKRELWVYLYRQHVRVKSEGVIGKFWIARYCHVKNANLKQFRVYNAALETDLLSVSNSGRVEILERDDIGWVERVVQIRSLAEQRIRAAKWHTPRLTVLQVQVFLGGVGNNRTVFNPNVVGGITVGVSEQSLEFSRTTGRNA